MKCKSLFRSTPIYLVSVLMLLTGAYAQNDSGTNQPAVQDFRVPDNIETTMWEGAKQVTAHLKDQSVHLFKREPLGFDWSTLQRIVVFALQIPLKVPEFMKIISEQRKLLGGVGSLVIFGFLLALISSIAGRKSIRRRLRDIAEPFKIQVKDSRYKYIQAGINIISASLVPLIFYGLVNLVSALIQYHELWFLSLGTILKLWVAGTFILTALEEILMNKIVTLPPEHARPIYRVSRWVVLYIILALAILSIAEAFNLPDEFLNLLSFLISLTISIVALLLLLKKKAITGLLPNLNYTFYQVVYRAFDRLFYPVMYGTFITGLLWSFGYKNLCRSLWIKTWAVAGFLLALIIIHDRLMKLIVLWYRHQRSSDDAVQFMNRSLRTSLNFTSIIVGSLVTLRLLNLFDPVVRAISFPIMFIGDAGISLWILIKAVLVLFGFIIASRIVRSYLDYKIYPKIGLEEGLAYSINTFIGYVMIMVGFMFSLRVLGLDLKLLMVFAGAIGIGIGFGLQHVASNLVSGLILIFGRSIRKGDWIQTGTALGYVREVGLSATRVLTRDNIEYIIPNSQLISDVIVNHTLTDPEIRIHIPVGVAYKSNPEEVNRVLIDVAIKNKNLSKTRPPNVLFSALGESSLDFDLLVWIDIRKFGDSDIKSELLHEIFSALRKANIEIPFPQRDIHIQKDFPVD